MSSSSTLVANLAYGSLERASARRNRSRRMSEFSTAFNAWLRKFTIAWIFPLAVLGLWWLAADRGWVAEQILPNPTMVASTFRELWDSGDILNNLGVSLLRVLYGFVAGALIGLALGIGIGLSQVAKDYLYPLFRVFAQVPSLGWLPLLMMVVGIEESLKIILIAKAVAVPITINTYQGIQGVPTRYIEVARVYGFSRWQLLRKVVLPAAFPPIWNGIRYGMTHAWLALVAVELLASSEGLGFMIVYGRQLFQLDVVIAAVIVVGFVGYAIDKILALVEARLLHWRRQSF